MERFKQKLLQAGIPFRENEPLAAHCTFKIGGPAQLFVQPQTEQHLVLFRNYVSCFFQLLVDIVYFFQISEPVHITLL